MRLGISDVIKVLHWNKPPTQCFLELPCSCRGQHRRGCRAAAWRP